MGLIVFTLRGDSMVSHTGRLETPRSPDPCPLGIIHVVSVMIELNRSLYMDQATGERLLSFDKFRVEFGICCCHWRRAFPSDNRRTSEPRSFLTRQEQVQAGTPEPRRQCQQVDTRCIELALDAIARTFACANQIPSTIFTT
jgi:hypothetical protein